MHFEDMLARAQAVRDRYIAVENRRYGRGWTREEIMLGFLGDVGDLAKLIQAAEGVRDISDAHAKLAHELSDCLWSVIILADAYGIDLAEAFVDTMDEIEAHLAG